MKKICNFVLIFFLLTFILALNCSAHSGKTDSSGGHYNHSTGEYHYHHGYPAHDHHNGKCPYLTYDDDEVGEDSQKQKDSQKHKRVKYKDDDLENIIVWSALIGYFTVIMTSGIKFDLDEKTKIPFSRYGTEDHFALVLLTQIIHLFPVMMLGIPWYAVIVVFFAECFVGTFVFCIPEFALWICAFVVTIYGPQDAWAIVYYIFFAIYCIYFIFQLVKQIQSMACNKRSNR